MSPRGPHGSGRADFPHPALRKHGFATCGSREPASTAGSAGEAGSSLPRRGRAASDGVTTATTASRPNAAATRAVLDCPCGRSSRSGLGASGFRARCCTSRGALRFALHHCEILFNARRKRLAAVRVLTTHLPVIGLLLQWMVKPRKPKVPGSSGPPSSRRVRTRSGRLKAPAGSCPDAAPDRTCRIASAARPSRGAPRPRARTTSRRRRRIARGGRDRACAAALRSRTTRRAPCAGTRSQARVRRPRLADCPTRGA